MVNLLVGHSSFYLRNGWIKKGVEYVQKNKDENIFSKSNIKAIDELGIGSVMVQSLKFWLIMLDIIGKKDKEFYLKREIEYILKMDPYLQKINTLWLLHTYIMEREKKDENPVLWNLFIKNKKNSVFTEEEARDILALFYKEEKEIVSERSIKDSVNVFIKTYYKDIDLKVDPEDNLFSPFIKLNYLQKNENGKYYFRDIYNTEIAEELIFFLLKRIVKDKQISIMDSYSYINGIIKMRINEYEKLISKLENREFLFVDRAAGLQNINLIKDISEKEIIQLIMERE
ncbi:DUF4007 family protein [Fusobacterium mortiferum]|uniref:DUF4007 family protein n=1 Tax=Fusobacterium mortiferum TaxID=850 RepID=A0A414Q190_FUSMR|nr:DUF4007 family protein [Fusobacterium mortiferum]MCI6382623.1 DUF4007 family protein [Fusobacterium mortiferum]RHF64368.1 DUF4007 family protein [Fusobacterium mortiferum]RHF74412.1 DUF4007 family protein [Fusobacterium mortiferum]